MDIYYETPRLPMFMIMEEFNLVRVRSLKYIDGKMNAVLADWDAHLLSTKFYTKEFWNDEYEEPFYCIYKMGEKYYKNLTELMHWSEEEAGQWDGRHTWQEIFKCVLDRAKILGCPIFESLDDARNYVFRTMIE